MTTHAHAYAHLVDPGEDHEYCDDGSLLDDVKVYRPGPADRRRHDPLQSSLGTGCTVRGVILNDPELAFMEWEDDEDDLPPPFYPRCESCLVVVERLTLDRTVVGTFGWWAENSDPADTGRGEFTNVEHLVRQVVKRPLFEPSGESARRQQTLERLDELSRNERDLRRD